MKRHYQTCHLNPFPNACSQCNKKFRRKLQLKKHEIKAHSGSYPYTCTHCQKGFLNAFTFKRHLTIHKLENKMKKCSDCQEIFMNWTKLVEHRRKVHKKEQRLSCDLCDKTFSRKPNIKQHMRLHLSTTEVLQCSYENCPKFYSNSRNLASHVRAKHEGRRWICDYCKRELSTMQKLQQHIRAHLDPQRAKMLLKKRSTISKLVGLDLPQGIEHQIINNCKVKVNALLPPDSSATELSDN